ncbi:MAG TPA: ATP phosphoribosyltransferase regulatory subunit, partial [Candidatus Dormibacteraeota bacterium]
DVGHADFIPAVLDTAGLDAATRLAVVEALQRRDLVAVEAALDGTEVGEAERRLLLAFPALRGGRDLLDTAALDLPHPRPRAVLDQLVRLWQLLEDHGVTDLVHLDLGAVRDWDYYTGTTFEVFSLGSGFPLGTGGRYDGLLARFGAELPATGFVLHVDRCLDMLERRSGASAPVSLRVAWSKGAHGGALRLAAQLRARGCAAIADLEATPGGDVPESAAALVTSRAVHWPGSAGVEHGSIEDAAAALAP